MNWFTDLFAETPLERILGKQDYREQMANAKKHARLNKAQVPEGLSSEEQLVIFLYTTEAIPGFGYKQLNDLLRGKQVTRSDELKEWGELLVAALQKLPCHDGECSRDMPMHDHVLALHAPGSIVQYGGFTSASVYAREPYRNRALAKIKSSRSGRLVGALSRYPAEEELIFLPGARFRVLSLAEEMTHVVIELEEV